MKKKVTFFLCILAVFAAACGLVGCGGRKPAHYDFLVTFNYNAEHLGLNTTYAEQYLGAMNGQRVLQPVKTSNKLYNNSDFKERQVEGYEVVGWYTAVLDENGNARRNEDGSVMLDREWNFASDVVTQDVTLYAKLSLKPLFRLCYDGKVQKEERYVAGTTVRENVFSVIKPKKDGYTFYGYYADEDLTEKFTFPYVMGETDVVIYAKFIEGENWNIVTTADEFIKAYGAGAKIYVDDELDFDGKSFNPKVEFAGEINGNSHTLSNIACTITDTINVHANMGLFGKIRQNAKIYDIRFENVQITVNTVTAVPVRAALFAYEIEEGATLEHVVVTGEIARGSIAEGGEATLYAVCTNSFTLSDTCDFTGIVGNDY